MKSYARNWGNMPKDTLVISANVSTVHIPVKMRGLVIVVMPPIPICPPPINEDELKSLINQKDNAVHLYNFDKIRLESKQGEINRRERVRFQNINARVQSKIAQRAYQNKKAKGK